MPKSDIKEAIYLYGSLTWEIMNFPFPLPEELTCFYFEFQLGQVNFKFFPDEWLSCYVSIKSSISLVPMRTQRRNKLSETRENAIDLAAIGFKFWIWLVARMAQVVWTNYEKNKVKAIFLDAEDASKVSDISFSLKGTSENSTHPGIKPMAPMNCTVEPNTLSSHGKRNCAVKVVTTKLSQLAMSLNLPFWTISYCSPSHKYSP